MTTPQITLIPFAELPECAKLCGTLFDVNGKCVPPANPGASEDQQKQCFCSDSRLTPLTQGTAGICDPPCTGTDTKEGTLSAIQQWYGSFCGVEVSNNENAGTGTNPAVTTVTARPNSGGGDWLSSHWKWIVMLVIMVVGITAIWIGACVWRRHYIKKKERAHQLGKKALPHSSAVAAPWPPGTAPPPNGVFMSPANHRPATSEKKAKRVSKWVPKERT